jgi:hypothetical protein
MGTAGLNSGYAVTVKGAVGPAVRVALGETDVTVVGGTTVLREHVGDQAALFGLLQRIQDLGLEVIEVHRVPNDLNEST